MKHENIKKGATLISVILWCAAAVTMTTGSYVYFALVGILAVTAQVIGVNAAQKYGEVLARES